MYKYRGVRKTHLIDGKYIRTDSIMEAEFIKSLVENGFSGKWRRSRFGIGIGYLRYTPDVELSILHDNMNRRALVEFKPNNVSDFPVDRRKAMLATSRFYKDAVCLLYVKKMNMWFQLEPHGTLHEFGVPIPGGVTINQLSRPRIAIPVRNKYGRAYFVRPGHFFLQKSANGLEFFLGAFFTSPKYKNRKRRK